MWHTRRTCMANVFHVREVQAAISPSRSVFARTTVAGRCLHFPHNKKCIAQRWQTHITNTNTVEDVACAT